MPVASRGASPLFAAHLELIIHLESGLHPEHLGPIHLDLDCKPEFRHTWDLHNWVQNTYSRAVHLGPVHMGPVHLGPIHLGPALYTWLYTLGPCTIRSRTLIVELHTWALQTWVPHSWDLHTWALQTLAGLSPAHL